MNTFSLSIILILLAVCSSCSTEKKNSQNPSPMEEHIRAHERVDGSECPGYRGFLEDIFLKAVPFFIPDHIAEGDTIDLLIHFHGSSIVTEYAACAQQRKIVVLTINLGSGSSKYEKPFLDHRKFTDLVDATKIVLKQNGLFPNRIIISGFSAGYGALRAILSNADHAAQVSAAILLDGLHTDYIPEGKTLYEGGKLNTEKLEAFLSFAELAIQGKKKFLFTHSSIFPGTYASTTECADYMIKALGLVRTPTLMQGPLGMQLLGTTEKEGLMILAFAGNTAPDHIDHLHGLSAFIDRLLY